MAVGLDEEARRDGLADGLTSRLGRAVGLIVRVLEGETLVDDSGEADGDLLGRFVGEKLGDDTGEADGFELGLFDKLVDGSEEGTSVGIGNELLSHVEVLHSIRQLQGHRWMSSDTSGCVK